MVRKEGIIVKVTRSHIVLMCSDDTFKNVRRSGTSIPLLGERFVYEERKLSPSLFMYAGAACALLIIAFALNWFQVVNLQPAYIVCLDINPSLEIQTGRDLKVSKLDVLNESGAALAAGIQYEGKKLPEVLDLILEECTRQLYLKKEEKGLIAVTVISLGKAAELKENQVRNFVDRALVKREISADIITARENRTVLEEARHLGVSVNKYRLYKDLAVMGIPLTIEEIKGKTIKEMLGLESGSGEDLKDEANQSSNISDMTKPEKGEIEKPVEKEGTEKYNELKEISEPTAPGKPPVPEKQDRLDSAAPEDLKQERLEEEENDDKSEDGTAHEENDGENPEAAPDRTPGPDPEEKNSTDMNTIVEDKEDSGAENELVEDENVEDDEDNAARDPEIDSDEEQAQEDKWEDSDTEDDTEDDRSPSPPDNDADSDDNSGKERD